MKIRIIRGFIILLIVLTFLTMPISFFIFMFTADSIETVYKNPTEEHIKIIEESYNVSLLNKADNIMLTSTWKWDNADVQVEFSIPAEDADRYLKEHRNKWNKGGIQYTITTKIINDDYYFYFSGMLSDGSPIAKMIKANGTKQELLHALKGLLGICIYCIILILLFKILKRQKLQSKIKEH